MILFSKSVDNLEIAYKTRSIWIRVQFHYKNLQIEFTKKKNEVTPSLTRSRNLSTFYQKRFARNAH